MRIKIIMCGKINKKGFTLAETLMTLMIIGVIASMTIPSLRKSTSQQESVVGLKRMYSALNQAVMLSENVNGPLSRWNFNLDHKTFFNTYLGPYLNVMKSCDTNNDCWSGKISYVNGAEEAAGCHKIILADGTRIATNVQSGDKHAHIYADINGAKPPNSYGTDVFIFTVTAKGFTDYMHNVPEGGVYIFGTGIDRSSLLSSCRSEGYSCGALIAVDGWKISNDYPF